MSIIGNVLRLLADVSVPVFVVSSMLSMGLSLRFSQILLPGTRRSTVLGVFLANFLVVPAIALTLGQLIPLNPSIAIGLLLLAAGSGAPLLPKLVQIARGHLALATSLVVMLMVTTIIFLPVVLPLLIGSHVAANRWDLARPLIFYMLVPLALGLSARRWLPGTPARLLPVTNGVANVAFVVAIARLVVVNAEGLGRALGTGPLLAAVVFLVGSFLAGYFLAGSNPADRLVGGLATAQRDISAALLLATTNFANRPDVSVMVVLVGLLGLVGLVATSIAFRVFARPEPVRVRVPAANKRQ